MAKNIITVDDAYLRSLPMDFDNLGRPIIRIFGTAGEDVIRIKAAQFSYEGKAVFLGVFGGPGDDTIFSVPHPNPIEVHYYGDWGSGGRGTSFPWPTRGTFANETHVGDGAIVNNFARSADDTYLHGGHYADHKGYAKIHRFDLDDDRLIAEASQGWEIDGFRFHAVSSGGGVKRAVIERVDLSFDDFNERTGAGDPITDGQMARIKFAEWGRPAIEWRGSWDKAAAEVDKFVQDLVDDGVLLL